jgi:hypothetical protein
MKTTLKKSVTKLFNKGNQTISKLFFFKLSF